MNDLLRRVFATDSGMLAIWQPERFQGIVDYDTWEPELLEDEDISRHIGEGGFVPLNVQADGAFDCAIRVGTAGLAATLTDREERYLLVSSEPYLFRCLGTLAISGLEHIGRDPGDSGSSIPLPAGDWAITVHFIDWTQEPGATTADGDPTPDALADFVVLVNPPAPEGRFRTKVETFEEPGDS